MATPGIREEAATLGLAATGSHDVEVADVEVPRERTVSLAVSAPQHTGPLYAFPVFAFPVFALLASGVAAVPFAQAAGRKLLGMRVDPSQV